MTLAFFILVALVIFLMNSSYAVAEDNSSTASRSTASIDTPLADVPSPQENEAAISESEPWDTPDPYEDQAGEDSDRNTSDSSSTEKPEKDRGEDKVDRESGETMEASSSSSGPVNHDNHPAVPTEDLPTDIPVQVLSNTGAAASSILIAVPPGRNGMQPGVSLNYNSNGGNGWVGVGWNLGMGAVQRSTKRGVDYSANDFVVTLNGSTSELVKRTDWNSGIYDGYEAKTEGAFTKYLHNTSDNSWKAIAKDGTQYFFGQIDDSKQQKSPSETFKWYLDEVMDTNGNFMTYTYWKDASNNEVYLARIDYAGHYPGADPAQTPDLQPTNSIIFTLDDGSRTDATIKYSMNFPVKTAYRLDEIEVTAKVGGADKLVRKYILTYDTSGSSGRSLLEGIVEYGSDGETPLYQTDFEWDMTESALVENDVPRGGYRDTQDGSVYPLIAGDFNGDGRLDFGKVCDGSVKCGIEITLSTENGWEFQGFGPEGKFSPNQDFTNSYVYPIFTGDFNGDGKSDIGRVTYTGVHVQYMDDNDTWQQLGSTMTEFGVDDGYSNNNTYPVVTGDFNGDGRTDIGRVSNTGFRTFYIDENNNWQELGSKLYDFSVINDGYTTNNKYPIITGDFNGDGRTDIGRVKNNGVKIYYMDENDVWQLFTDTLPDFGFNDDYTNNKDYPIFTGDFNGDGLSDIGRVDDDVIRFYLSDGTGNWIAMNDLPELGKSDDYVDNLDHPIFVGDFNGDGITDIGRAGGKPSGSGGTNCTYNNGVFIYLSDGLGNWDKPWQFIGINDLGSCVYGYSMPSLLGYEDSMVGDINGDGIDDIGRMYGDGFKFYHSGSLTKDTLTKIENGIGGTTSIDYAPSSKYDNKILPFKVKTVSSVTVDDGNGTKSVTSYDYAGGHFDFSDREYRGFEYVTITKPNGTYLETRYHQDNVYKGLPSDQTIYDEGGNLYSVVINIYDCKAPLNGYQPCIDSDDVYFPYLDQQDKKIYDGDNNVAPRHIVNNFTYDDYGNILSKYYGEYLGGGLYKDEKTEEIDYVNYTSGEWMKSLPEYEYVKDKDGNNKAWTKYHYYTDGTGNVWKVEKWNNTPNESNPVTEYTYDAYGNIDKVKNPRGYETDINYDLSAHTFPEKITNPLGHKVERAFDPRFGTMLWEEDNDLNMVSYDYDMFGRLVKKTMPYPYGVTEYSYIDYGDPNNQHIREESRGLSGELIHWVESYFDGSGRTRRVVAGGPDAVPVYVDTEYDERGLLYSQTFPYYEGDTVYDIFYDYDPLERPIETIYPDGSYSTISYDRGRISYIDPNGHQKIAEKDIYGRIVSIEEYAGEEPDFTLYATTTYEYDKLSNLTKVTDAAGNMTDISYNSLSRKTSMDDPDMGLWEYQYDLNGNLTYQKDAKGQEISFQYDELDRIVLKDYPSPAVDISYTYDESWSSNSSGRLTKVSDNTGTTKFWYDELGQIARSEKIIYSDSSAPFTTETLYDALGRVERVVYPDGADIFYTYNGNGLIQHIGSWSEIYVTYESYTAAGTPLLVSFNNGVTTQYAYDPETNRLTSINTKDISSTSLLHLDYYYDNAGNITHIEDHVNGDRSRSYEYDHLDRLIEADSVAYGGKILYQYDEIGNITYNCRMGHYTYDPDHPHAVKEIRRSNGILAAQYDYDDNGNMIESREYNLAGDLISAKTRTFSYDYDNMSTSIAVNLQATVNEYDAFGNRVLKMIPGPTTTVYIGKIYDCENGNCSKYVFAGALRVVKIDSTDTYYYHTDHLDSSNVITGSSGTTEDDLFYYPFGELISSNPSPKVKHTFNGHEWDAEYGLYYMGARYYDPKIARFISADTIVPMAFYPQSFNRYSFTVNNPIVLRELDGHFFGFGSSSSSSSSNTYGLSLSGSSSSSNTYGLSLSGSSSSSNTYGLSLSGNSYSGSYGSNSGSFGLGASGSGYGGGLDSTSNPFGLSLSGSGSGGNPYGLSLRGGESSGNLCGCSLRGEGSRTGTGLSGTEYGDVSNPFNAGSDSGIIQYEGEATYISGGEGLGFGFMHIILNSPDGDYGEFITILGGGTAGVPVGKVSFELTVMHKASAPNLDALQGLSGIVSGTGALIGGGGGGVFKMGAGYSNLNGWVSGIDFSVDIFGGGTVRIK